MKQVLRKGLGEIVVDELPDPVAIPHHALVRPAYSVISSGTETASIHRDGLLKEVAARPSQLRSVLDAMRNIGPGPTLREVRAKFSEYAVVGYAGAGIIVERHPTLSDLEVGARVAYGGEGTGHAETVLVGRNLLAHVPDSVPLDQAAFATLGAIAMNAVRTATLGLGDVVAIVGLGIVGQLAAQLARLQGGVVVATDLKADRVDLARRLGAQHAVTGDGPILDAVRAATSGRGADCVIVAAAARSAAPCHLALQLCRDRGRLVVVGAVDLSFPWEEMYRKEIQLLMSRAYGPGSYDPTYERLGRDYPVSYVRWTENRNMEEFLRLLKAGTVRVDALVTHRVPLGDAPRAYDTILAPETRSLAVLLEYPAGAEDVAPAYQPRHRVEAVPARREGGLGVALVGAGNLARWAHLPILRRMPGVRLQAVCSSSGVRGKSYALRFRGAYAVSDYAEVLGDPAVDVVILTNRHTDHAPFALAALEAGKHVFVEKPMALTEGDCRALVRAVETSGRLLTVGFNRRFAPLYAELRRHVAARTGPGLVHCRVNSPSISGTYWMADPATGGAVLGEACHFADLMCWLLDSEPTEVAAFSMPTDRPDVVGQNNVAATIRFADGSIGGLSYSTVGPKASAGERVEVFAPGFAGSVENFRRLVLRGQRRPGRWRLWPDKGYRPQLAAFLDAVRTGGPPAVTVRDGARATLVCLRLLESARVGSIQRVSLDASLHA